MNLVDIEAALAAGGGIIVRRDHPRLRNALDRARRAGLLMAVAPGVLAASGEAGVDIRVKAAFALEPAAVVTGRAAAALTWWREIPVPEVTVACGARRTCSPGLVWERRLIEPDLVLEQGGIRVSNPSLTVLDLMPVLGGSAIDEALRRRAVRLDELVTLFETLPSRRGDAQRRVLLTDSRDEPWSEAERHLHRRYRSLELPYPYFTNHRVDLPDGTHRIVDLAIPDLLLGFEADGYAYHSSPAAFARDRRSDALLATIFWQRIRFDASGIMAEDPEVTELMHAVIRAREELLRGTRPPGARVRRGG